MKKLTVAALAVAITVIAAVPALALIRNRAYVGPVGSGAGNASAGLTLRTKDGVAKSVTRFEFRNVPTNCSGSTPTAVTGELTGAMAVNRKRKFHGTSTFNEGRATVTVSGVVAKNKRRMSGTMRARGTITGCLHSDTGSLEWKALPLG